MRLVLAETDAPLREFIMWNMWSMHNFAMAQTDARRVRRKARQDVQRAQVVPQLVQIAITGDFNIEPDARGRRSHAELHWQAITRAAAEVAREALCRWDVGTGEASSIDRMPVTMPRSAWSCFRARFAPARETQMSNNEGWSDHAPMILCGACHAHLEPDARKVPQEIVASTELAENLSALVFAVDLDATFGGRPMERPRHLKVLLREAARLAHDELSTDGAPTQIADCGRLVAARPPASEYFRREGNDV